MTQNPPGSPAELVGRVSGTRVDEKIAYLRTSGELLPMVRIYAVLNNMERLTLESAWICRISRPTWVTS